MPKKNKKKFVDDGRTVYSMDGLSKHKVKNESEVSVTRREKSAMIKAGLMVYMPRLFLIILGFTIAFVLMYFWLKY